MTTHTWSPQQAEALTKVAEWLKTGSAPYFYLAGYAGTGKTTLAKHFAEGVDGRVVYGSFTGKAASVMRAKGCHDATTIHRLIYQPRMGSTTELREMREELEQIEDKESKEAIVLRLKIQKKVKDLKKPGWDLNRDADLRHAALIIIDECSMVNAEMGRDLMSFGVPILVLGDPAQLPPVFGAGYFTKGKPDYMLTEVHRQARESGILQLATDIRLGKGIDYCDLGDAIVVPRGELDPMDIINNHDQVLVGRNKTRHATNRRVRELMGYTSALPEKGDRLVCLKNNHELGLLNGEIYTARNDAREMGDTTSLCVESEGGTQQWVEAWTAPLLGEELMDHNKDTQEFGFGYVLTCHKSQGSQWDRVIVFDESRCFRADAARWLYTAATRAANRLTIVR